MLKEEVNTGTEFNCKAEPSTTVEKLVEIYNYIASVSFDKLDGKYLNFLHEILERSLNIKDCIDNAYMDIQNFKGAICEKIAVPKNLESPVESYGLAKADPLYSRLNVERNMERCVKK